MLPAVVIEKQINNEITRWLDADLWISRDFEINRARKLL